MRNLIKFSLIVLTICVLFPFESIAQYRVRYYPPRGSVYYSPRRTVVVQQRPIREEVYVYSEPRTTVYHVEEPQKEIVYIHKKKEVEYRYVEEEEEYPPYSREYKYSNDECYKKKYCKDECYDDNRIEMSEMWQMPIHFNLNSSKLKYRNGHMNLFEVAAFMRKHQKATISLFAYGDIETGTNSQNKHLARKRADVVIDELVSKGIDVSRITTHVIGSDDQYYGINEWNRCVIIKAN